MKLGAETPHLLEGLPSRRSTRAVVDLGAIAHNLTCLTAGLRRGARVIGVVKAQAYGHGALAVGRWLLRRGVWGLAVATADEAHSLRRGGVTAPILVLSPVAPEELAPLVAREVHLTVAGPDLAQRAAAVARAQGGVARLHLKVDTGMGRVGVKPDEALGLLDVLATTPGLRVEGLFTHLASAESDPEVTDAQLRRFAPLVPAARARVPGLVVHVLNTAGTVARPDAAYDAVRLGIGLYGYSPFPPGGPTLDLKPALEWRTAVSQVKVVDPGTPISYGGTFRAPVAMTVATLPVGYADGLRRALTGQEVILGGDLWPVVGRVTMDQTMVALPGRRPIREGDEAVLIGQRGALSVTADDWARRLGTVSYEVLTGVGARVPRAYRRPSAEASRLPGSLGGQGA